MRRESEPYERVGYCVGGQRFDDDKAELERQLPRREAAGARGAGHRHHPTTSSLRAAMARVGAFTVGRRIVIFSCAQCFFGPWLTRPPGRDSDEGTSPAIRFRHGSGADRDLAAGILIVSRIEG